MEKALRFLAEVGICEPLCYCFLTAMQHTVQTLQINTPYNLPTV